MSFSRASSGMRLLNTPDNCGSIKGIPCKNVRCDQEILCVNNEDYYCSRDCYSIKLEREQIEVDTTAVKFKRRTIIGRGGTGLLNDRGALDRLIIRVDSQFGRTVTSHKGSIGGVQKKSKKKGQPLDPEELLRKQKKEEDKRRLRELLNNDVDAGSSDETTSSSDDDLDEAQSSAVNSVICPPHPPLVTEEGKLLKAYVVNIVSPWEIHIQTGKMIQKTGEIEAICNRVEGLDPRLVDENWSPQVGGVCCAKFEDKMYRAKILEKDGNTFRVLYIDYGNKELVPCIELHQLNPEVTLIPAQCIFFRLSNVKPKTHWENDAGNSDVIKFTVEHLEGAVVGLHIDAVERNEVHVGKLKIISSLSGLIEGDFGEALVKRNLADPDSYYLEELKNLQF
ncbi:nuclease domain-containing protein 1 [Orchesella cincta]|uniref:Nuclease domain-containing protein 1 n=1 Tax=Orchesella cincta TaxID=48709 RepID=A0A1D2NBB5_ORCCI|nr:nuclease domain-containing protein 1 [Orchesella cincta]